ncbi:MAG: 50S ribosomal protein L22 [Thermoplasmatota archaeon]
MAYYYAAQNVDAETTSRAVGREIPVKPKFGINVARFLKGMPLDKAKTYLELVIEKKRSIPFVTHKRHVKHRRDISGPGAYPVTTCAAFLRVLKDAEANAEYKGLDPETMYIWHAAVSRGSPLKGTMARAQGRATQWDKQTSNIEIVLSERVAEGAEAKKAIATAERKKAARRLKAAKKKEEAAEEEE